MKAIGSNLCMCLALMIFLSISFCRLVIAAPGNESIAIAQSGNVSLLNIDMTQISDMWQGFYGSVTGGLQLSDGANHTFYDWTVVKANGEIIASRQIISDWSAVGCTTQQEIYEEQERLHMDNLSTANINRTFLNTTHPSFDVGGVLINGCRSTLTNNVTSRSSVFWNVLLNVNSTSTIYVSIMDDNIVGFNGTVSDFQLLVPVDRTIGYNMYNIYVELS